MLSLYVCMYVCMIVGNNFQGEKKEGNEGVKKGKGKEKEKGNWTLFKPSSSPGSE